MAGLRSILEKYVIFKEDDYWKCKNCPKECNGRPCRIIAHLTGKEGQGITICPGLTPEEKEKIDREVQTVEQQLKQRRGEIHDTRQKKGNKKRKSASGGETRGSNPTEANMPPAPSGGSNSSGAPCEINSVSEAYPRRLERPVGVAEPVNNSHLSNPDVIRSPSENWYEAMLTSSEHCSLPGDEGMSSDPIINNPEVEESNALAVLENNNDGVEKTNDVGTEPDNMQSSGLDTTQVPSPHGLEGTDMDLADQIHPPPQGNSDRMNDQRMHCLQCGVEIDAPAIGNASGVGMAREPSFTEPPPRPSCFDSGLWDFYLKIDAIPTLHLRHKFKLARNILRQKSDRVPMLRHLVSVCSEVRNYAHNNPDKSDPEDLQIILYQSFFKKSRRELQNLLVGVKRMETKIKEAAEQEALMLGTERKTEMDCWLGYAGRIKSDVSYLDFEAMKAKSPSDIMPLLMRMEGLKEAARKLREMGAALLSPVPKYLLTWNPSFMSCGSSQLESQTPSGQYPTEFSH